MRAAATPQRLSVGFFASPDPGPTLELEPFIGLFHRFVQERQLEGLLIDVADYAHVPDGPGILLVGHEVDYAIGRPGGRTGLLTTRKRIRDLDATLVEVLRDALRKALIALRAVQASGTGGLRFRTDAVEIQLLDRLVAPNDAAAFEALRGDVEAALREVYGETKLEIAREGDEDARLPLTFRVTVQEAADVDVLLERLGGTAQMAEDPQSDWDISVEDLKRLRDDGGAFLLLDVRESHEYEICNLGGELVPLAQLGERMPGLDRDGHIVVHCRSGARSARAVEVLRRAGFANSWNVRGGILAWIDRIDPSLPRY
jgi:rhodanese-related sulfurtransferase